MAKKLNNLYWIEELLPLNILKKPMFGGFAYYLDGLKLVLVLFEKTGDKIHLNKKYPFEIWNGCLFPAERIYHEKILKDFPFLISHPVLPKWLYLPSETENFEELATQVLKKIKANKLEYGVIPKKKKSTLNIKKSMVSKKSEKEKIDTRKPQMFNEDNKSIDLSSLKKISDLKNLGPTSESLFLKAKIKSPKEFMKLGWKKATQKIVEINPKYRHSMFTYAIMGAYLNKDYRELTTLERSEATGFTHSLKKVKKNLLKSKKK